MYVKPVNRITNREDIIQFLKQNSFGLLCTMADDDILATHVPFDFQEEGSNWYLYSHIALANPQKATLQNGCMAKVIFQGSHHYISSSWYEKEDVPTWNYQAVHIKGEVELLSEEATRASLSRLISIYEKKVGEDLSMSDLSEKTMRQIKGIVPFRIRIDDVFAASKMSQNRDREDRRNIVNALSKLGPEASKVSDIMREDLD